MAFFSGTDTSTLRSEGNDTNCFVSLIVNNEGTYCAAITRKVKLETEVITKTKGLNYEFFGDGNVQINSPSETTNLLNEEVIQYFMLDVEVEPADNPLDYLDIRFDEIEAKKKAAIRDSEKGKLFLNNINQNTRISKEDDQKDFYEWLHSGRKEAEETKKPSVSSPTLFDKQTMIEMIDADSWTPDPKIIHYLACQLLTCSLIVNKDIDLKQWVKVHMEKKYDQIFSGACSIEFEGWADSYIEFILNHYSDENVPDVVYDDWDEYISKIAKAIGDEIAGYSNNDYIEGYIDKLSRYVMQEV